MTECDLVDSVLDFENQCYDEGFKEGSAVGKHRGFVEGRELGVQTGFLRYFSLGILQARSKQWSLEELPEKTSKQAAALAEHVNVSDLSNDPTTVDKVEMAIKRGKNKAKLIAATTKGHPVEIHENKIAFVRDDAIEDLS